MAGVAGIGDAEFVRSQFGVYSHPTSFLIDGEGRVRSNVVASQSVHELFDGVVPEIASREHLTNWPAVSQEALDQAGIEAIRQQLPFLVDLLKQVGRNHPVFIVDHHDRFQRQLGTDRGHQLAHAIDALQPEESLHRTLHHVDRAGEIRQRLFLCLLMQHALSREKHGQGDQQEKYQAEYGQQDF